MSEILIPPTKTSLIEALHLADEILHNIELDEIPLTNIALKTSRLARLLNDFDLQKIMEFEAGGYPLPPGGYTQETWALCEKAGRVYEQKNDKSEEVHQYAYAESIHRIEEIIHVSEFALKAASDPSISVSSANPHQYVASPGISNRIERSNIITNLTNASNRLGSRRSFIYSYVQTKYYELKYSGLADDIFSRIRLGVDKMIGTLLPESTKRFSAVYDNLISENPENWANAVHSCRRILQDLADLVFPATDKVRNKEVNGKTIAINLGADNYINRIIAFVEDNSDSERFEELVGSQMTYLGDRLDSIFKAVQKGSHASVGKDEADRYVVYTYLLVGDLLSIYNKKGQ